MPGNMSEPTTFGAFDYFSVCCSIIMNSISIVGIAGNLLSIFVFSSKSFRNISINILLAALGCADMALLVLAIPVFSLAPIADYFPKGHFVDQVYGIATCYLYPVTLMFQCASIWLLIAITLERWLAVCRPFLIATLCTKKSAVAAVIIISILSAVYNFIRFWEFSLENGLIVHNLRNNPHYLLWYVNVAGLLTMCFIPLFVLLVFNIGTVHELIQTNRSRKQLTNAEKNSQNTTTMLMCVVLVFICCYSFSFVLNLLEIFHPDLFLTIAGFVLSDVNNILALCNSASTWIFYLHFSSRYRQAAKQFFLEAICRKKVLTQNIDGMSMSFLANSNYGSNRMISERSPHRSFEELNFRSPGLSISMKCPDERKPILDKL